MKNHAWEIEHTDGTLRTGEDGFPPLDVVDQAQSLVLTLPESPVRFRVKVPKGKRLVFFRTNTRPLETQDGRVLGKACFFFIGWKSRENMKEKFIQMIHQSPKGEIFSCLLENDGRQD